MHNTYFRAKLGTYILGNGNYTWRQTLNLRFLGKSQRDVVEKVEWESIERKKVWRDRVEREMRRSGKKKWSQKLEKGIVWENWEKLGNKKLKEKIENSGERERMKRETREKIVKAVWE